MCKHLICMLNVTKRWSSKLCVTLQPPIPILWPPHVMLCLLRRQPLVIKLCPVLKWPSLLTLWPVVVISCYKMTSPIILQHNTTSCHITTSSHYVTRQPYLVILITTTHWIKVKIISIIANSIMCWHDEILQWYQVLIQITCSSLRGVHNIENGENQWYIVHHANLIGWAEYNQLLLTALIEYLTAGMFWEIIWRNIFRKFNSWIFLATNN